MHEAQLNDRRLGAEMPPTLVVFITADTPRPDVPAVDTFCV